MCRSVDGVDRSLSRFHAITAAAHIERHALRRAEQDEQVVGDPRRFPADRAALRGLPAVGRGIPGAIPGTRPDQLRW